jgi:hypothetical protein
LALCGHSTATAGFSLNDDSRPFAEKFLGLLDAGHVKRAYEMLNPDVRSKYPIENLSQAISVRGARLMPRKTAKAAGPRRTFVRSVRQGLFTTSSRKIKAASVVVCFVENPNANFNSVSYTAVTVSRQGEQSLQIDNFQTTSVPVAPCN